MLQLDQYITVRDPSLSRKSARHSSRNSFSMLGSWPGVNKGEGKHRETKGIELARLPEFAADGYQQWQYPGLPTVPSTDKDPRQVFKINDVWETDAPYKDAAHMFAAEIDKASLADRLSLIPMYDKM